MHFPAELNPGVISLLAVHHRNSSNVSTDARCVCYKQFQQANRYRFAQIIKRRQTVPHFHTVFEYRLECRYNNSTDLIIALLFHFPISWTF